LGIVDIEARKTVVGYRTGIDHAAKPAVQVVYELPPSPVRAE
jgi:hypothetical protein